MEYIDLRSDTVTVPTEEMLDAMRNAVTGDDVYQDDPTVKILEKKSAEILGKEAALFVPSGTFGNQLALLTHTLRGDEVIIPFDNHIVLHEVGAPAVISGVQLRLLYANSGWVDINELEKLYRVEDIHHPRTGLICLENPHSNGNVVSLENMKEVFEFSRSRNIPVHLDGARIFNAAIALGVEAKDISSFTDSVMFCFSKSLCAPVGSVLVGNNEFIHKARKNRKLMGGGMRQVGYLAAPCIICLEKMTQRLIEDHRNAKYMAEKLGSLGIFDIKKNRLDINMVFFKVRDGIQFSEEKFVNFLLQNKVKIHPSYNGEFRFVTHYYITVEDIDRLIGNIEEFLKKK